MKVEMFFIHFVTKRYHSSFFFFFFTFLLRFASSLQGLIELHTVGLTRLTAPYSVKILSVVWSWKVLSQH